MFFFSRQKTFLLHSLLILNFISHSLWQPDIAIKPLLFYGFGMSSFLLLVLSLTSLNGSRRGSFVYRCLGELWSGPLLHTPRFYLSPTLIRISNQRCVDGKVVVACALQYIFCSLNWLGYLLGLLRGCSHIAFAQTGISVPPCIIKYA